MTSLLCTPLRSRWHTLVATLAAAFMAVAARAQDPSTPQADDAGPVTVAAVAQHSVVRPGDRVAVAVILDHATGYHTWPAAAVTLPPDIAEFAQRTEIGLAPAAPAGVRLIGVQWPEAHPGQVPDFNTGKTMTAPLYSGRAVGYITVEISPGEPAGTLQIPVRVYYQACNEEACLQAEDAVIPVAIAVAADTAGDHPGDAALFAGYKAITGEPPEAPPPSPAAPTRQPAAGQDQGQSLLGFRVGDSVLVLFLVAALGGAILNLTPCVLPVIPIKIMTLVQHANSPARRVALGLWMALGVVAFWFVVGLPMALFSSALDPSRMIFGVWWVTLALGVVIAAMGLGIMGLFTINLPQKVYMVETRADSPAGSFMFGVMTAVLGLPCFGFVAGGLLVGTATLGWLKIMTIFTGLGVGMAAPYLVLSARPGLISRIPRTGPASELVKQVMGLLLIAAAAYFVAAGLKGLLTEAPYLSESIAWWVVAFFVSLAGVWLAIRTLRIARSAWPKVVMPVLAAIAMTGAIGFAAISADADREDYERRIAAAAAQSGLGEADIVTGTWIPYTAKRLEAARHAGHIVVVDFTADWCINCKFLKRTILDRDPVRSRLQKGDIVLLEVDNTSSSAPGWAFLRSLGQTGVPTLAIYGPGIEEPLKYNAYRADTVLGAIEQAKAPPTRQAAR